MGPPGSFKTECAKAVAESFGWESIHCGSLLRYEMESKTTLGVKIKEQQKEYRYSK